jgi:hypothetical protein
MTVLKGELASMARNAKRSIDVEEFGFWHRCIEGWVSIYVQQRRRYASISGNVEMRIVFYLI